MEANRRQRAATAAITSAIAEERGDELRAAVSKGDEASVQRMIDSQGECAYPLDHQNEVGTTALMKAAMWGQAAIARMLLSAGATVDVADARGRTALMLAAHNGDVAVIDALTASGARPAGAGELAAREGATDDGRTALMMAASAGHTEAVARLLAAGAQHLDVDTDGQTALQLARAQGHARAVALLEAHASADAQQQWDAGLAPPTHWGKLRRLQQGARATAAFGTPLRRLSATFTSDRVASLGASASRSVPGSASHGGSLFSSILRGEASLGASALSWVNAFTGSTANAARSLKPVVKGSFQRLSSGAAGDGGDVDERAPVRAPVRV